MKIVKMDKKIEKEQNRELEQFCRQIREYVQSGRIRECEQLIPQYMQKYPDSAVPHHLLGIVLEMKGKHVEAMKHFRAATALDAGFLPASYNMEQYSSFARKCTIRPAYGWEDCGRKGTHHGINTSGRRSEYSDKKGMFINETGKADHWILV